MGMFKKRGQIIDLTKLQEKGILQRSKAIAKENSLEAKNDVVDLSSMISKNQSETSNSNSSGFDFLSLANAGSGSNSTGNIADSNLDMQGLRNKIEDIEYKMEKFIERISKIEEKLSLI